MEKKRGKITPGTIKEGEYHPAANSALKYIRKIPRTRLCMYTEALASTALSGNRTAEICTETLARLRDDEPVSDRYLLGLAWTLKELEESHPKLPKKSKKV